MDSAIAKQLIDKIYEKRKAAALDLEKQIRLCHQQGDDVRITQIIDQLVDMFNNSANPLHVRNGGLVGLAGTAIALGVDIAPHMEKFIEPLLDCFVDPENRIRYFSAECLYNICKVSKGEVLVYFNEIFDALSKLAADSELSVKNGAELLDRLLKDIVAESASVYIPQYPETEKVRDQIQGVLVPRPDGIGDGEDEPRKAFSLARFIPLLRERIYVVSPFTRSYLASWITVLDSVPELELISYLPEFLDGLLKYLSDPLEDVRVATKTLLAEFLREIRDVSSVQKKPVESLHRYRPGSEMADSLRQADRSETILDLSVEDAERAAFILDREEHSSYDRESTLKEDQISDIDYRDTGAWIPGQGVKIDYPAIIEILIQQLDGDHDEIQQSTALRWLSEFLTFASEVMVPFTPRLIPAVLPNLAHHVDMIQSTAIRTNKLLFNVIQNLPPPVDNPPKTAPARIPNGASATPPPGASASTSRQSTMGSTTSKDTSSRDVSSPETIPEAPSPVPPAAGLTRSRGSAVDISGIPRPVVVSEGQQPPSAVSQSRPHSPASFLSTGQTAVVGIPEEVDPFDYQATVNELTVQFLSEYEETRVAALKWLIMLHQKAPKKILAMDDGTFPALLKTLSDSSEEVIKHDLQLLAQISSSSEEGYFKAFMINLLELFSTDRRLLDTRGSLIVRQLCLNLNIERIYRTFAEILEKEDDLEFASVIVQKLNIILITSPELAEFRKRLKSLETRQDGQALFTTLYRSWCHNAVAVFSLCLLAQAYEHASSLLYIFAELEITVPMLVQIDKLVQLIESPVFTYLRLQLLEPERYPHLFKCLYGLLMLLPQSSAFVSLRNRLNAVNSAGFLHITPRTSSVSGGLSTRSKLGREEIKWQELIQHFRVVQAKHEKARRQALGTDSTSFSEFTFLSEMEKPVSESGNERIGRPTGRPAMRRKVTGGAPAAGDMSISSTAANSANVTPAPTSPFARGGVLSPLNPRARGQASIPAPGMAAIAQQATKHRPSISQTRNGGKT